MLKRRGPRGQASSTVIDRHALTVDDVLAKYDLPEDVSAAVTSAVLAKQLPSYPGSLDTLLARLVKPCSGIKPELIHAVLKRSPSALKQTGEKLRGKLVSLQAALDCSEEELLSMVSSTRNLLGLKPDTIKGKISSLALVLGLPPSEATALVRKVPHLLCCNQDTIASKFKSLKQLVHRPHSEVVHMVLETPQLLFLNPESLQAKFDDMAALLQLSPAACGELAASKPLLLTSSAATMVERCTSLHQVTKKSRRWSEELKGLAPTTLGNVLLSGKVKVKRLVYLASTQQQEAVALTTLLNMTQGEFLAKFPGYKI